MRWARAEQYVGHRLFVCVTRGYQLWRQIIAWLEKRLIGTELAVDITVYTVGFSSKSEHPCRKRLRAVYTYLSLKCMMAFDGHSQLTVQHCAAAACLTNGLRMSFLVRRAKVGRDVEQFSSESHHVLLKNSTKFGLKHFAIRVRLPAT